jgi:lysophospholipase L1-like esterase
MIPLRQFARLAAFCVALAPVHVFAQAAAPPSPPAAAPANPPVARTEGRWEKEIAAMEARDKKTPPPADAALFIGSSSIRMWSTLAKDFGETPVVNHGFGGSEIADSTRYVDRLITPCKPRIIVMYAGTNDINAGKSPDRVLADFKAFVAAVRVKHAETPIMYISMNPNTARWSQRDKQQTANRLIAEYIKTTSKLAFIDTYATFIGVDGKPRESLLLADHLHLNADGYKAWAEIVKPAVVKQYEAAK